MFASGIIEMLNPAELFYKGMGKAIGTKSNLLVETGSFRQAIHQRINARRTIRNTRSETLAMASARRRCAARNAWADCSFM